MKIIITEHAFRQMFMDIRPDNFSYAGLTALFEYLVGYEEATCEEIELDVIALCCEYTEYEIIDDCLAEYGFNDREELEDTTTVIDVAGGGVIIQAF